MLSLGEDREAILRRGNFGQGHSSGTLFTDQGAFPCIVPYDDRASELRREAPFPRKGSRAMHQTTITVQNPEVLDYATTSHEVHGGSRFLPAPQRQPRARSMHASQIVLGQPTPGAEPEQSHASRTYTTKEVLPHYKIHYPIVLNKIQSVESRDVRSCLQPDTFTNYFTQYRRTHDFLGNVLDSAAESSKGAIPRPPASKKRFHVLTGEPIGNVWSSNNRRISGNRLLQNDRPPITRCNTLG